MTVRVGLVGLGNWGRRLATSLVDVEGAELFACYARTQGTRERFAAEMHCAAAPTLGAMLDAVDAVLIATPHTTHRHLVESAAAAGVHVMCEKPLALTATDADAAVAAAERAGVLLQVAHYRRRFAPIRRMKEMIEAAELGTLLQVDGHFSKPFGPDPNRPWRNDPDEAPAGAMTALGVHTVDDLLYLAGPIRRLAALSAVALAGSTLDDATTVLLEFASGVQGTLRTSLRTPTVASIAVFGSAGAARSENDGTRLLTASLPDDRWTAHDVEPIDGVRANLDAFIDSVRTGAPVETDGRSGAAVVAVMEAIATSAAASGAPIDVASPAHEGHRP